MNEETKAKFGEFEKALADVREGEYKKLNLPNEFGLGHQEVKHSTFLAHLLDPDRKQYGLKADQKGSKAYFLRLFLHAVEQYEGQDGSLPSRNKNILLNGSGTGKAVDLEAFACAGGIAVVTEQVGEKDKSRIDVLVVSEEEKYVLVIENKVFSTLHDDQLKIYEDRYADPSWKKVFVYLTPRGDLPRNADKTEAVNWCAFDYAKLKEVVALFKDLVDPSGGVPSVTSLTGTNKKRFTIALEDYMDNITTEVLEEVQEANEKYGKILATFPDIVEGLIGYINGARPLAVSEYCKEKLQASYVGTSRAWLYTKKMEAFFLKHGEDIGDKFFIVCQGKGGSKDADSMEIWLELHTRKSGVWSPAQQMIMQDKQIKAFQTKSEGKQDYRILPAQTLLNQTEMTERDGKYKPLADVKGTLDRNLAQFEALLRQVETILDTL